jgi:hypothetical protein
MSPEYYIQYNNKKVCLTDKDHFIEFGKHSGMVNTKLKKKLVSFNPLNAELNPICHLLILLGCATIVVFSRLRVNKTKNVNTVLCRV